MAIVVIARYTDAGESGGHNLTAYPWIHVAALVAYAAATLAVLVYAIPQSRRETDSERRLATAARAMKYYDPFSIAVLGVMVMTGAFALTGYKDALRERFFEQMGTILVWKLSFTFLLIILAAYLAFGLGNRLVGAVERDTRPEAGWVASMLLRIQITAALVLLLCGVIAWISRAM